MKMKTFVGTVGTILVVAGVTYFVVKHQIKEEIKENNTKPRSYDKDYEISNVRSKKESGDSNLSDEKVKLDERIAQRHQDAKNVVKEAINNIISDDILEHTKNDEAKKQLFEDIDNL